MFERIINRLTGTEFIASFLKSALRNQKNLLQYLHFRPDSASSAQRMERYMEQLLQELLLHDNASSVICRGILIRIFSLLGCGYEFSCSRKLEREINELIYEEILDYIKEHMTGTSTARWENQLSGVAPCQCLTPAGIWMQSLGFISIASFLHS